MKAFPRDSGADQQGMDLRDYFAAKAIAEVRWTGTADDILERAKECYIIADAMMEAREG
jgi:hypothetical protein